MARATTQTHDRFRGQNALPLASSLVDMRFPFPDFSPWTPCLVKIPTGAACYVLDQLQGYVVFPHYIGSAANLRYRLRRHRAIEHPLMTHARWRLLP
jgi:hypothetical protein